MRVMHRRSAPHPATLTAAITAGASIIGPNAQAAQIVELIAKNHRLEINAVYVRTVLSREPTRPNPATAAPEHRHRPGRHARITHNLTAAATAAILPVTLHALHIAGGRVRRRPRTPDTQPRQAPPTMDHPHPALRHRPRRHRRPPHPHPSPRLPHRSHTVTITVGGALTGLALCVAVIWPWWHKSRAPGRAKASKGAAPAATGRPSHRSSEPSPSESSSPSASEASSAVQRRKSAPAAKPSSETTHSTPLHGSDQRNRPPPQRAHLQAGSAPSDRARRDLPELPQGQQDHPARPRLRNDRRNDARPSRSRNRTRHSRPAPS